MFKKDVLGKCSSSTPMILLIPLRGCVMFVAYPHPQSFSQYGIEASLSGKLTDAPQSSAKLASLWSCSGTQQDSLETGQSSSSLLG